MKLNTVALAVMLMTGTCLSAATRAAEQPVVSPAPAGPSVVDGGTAGKTSVTPSPRNPAPDFTAGQEARIGEIARDYLLAHPEVLMAVSEKLQAQQRAEQMQAMTGAVLQYQDALLNDAGTPSYGPADAKVAVIEFFDYQCVVCARQAPVMASVMKANPEVRYVFKEWPIFAQRWDASLRAAETGLQVWQQKGAEAYLSYHNAVYATGHNEGKLKQADITKAAGGKLKGQGETIPGGLARTDTLAQRLGLRGTPGMIVMPVEGATAENVTVIPGGADQSALQAAIERAAGRAGEK